MGTLNLCIKMSEEMQKTRDETHHPRLRKYPETGEKWPILIWVNNGFWMFSQPIMIGCISSLLHLFRYIETQVQSIHKGISKNFYFRPKEWSWPF